MRKFIATAFLLQLSILVQGQSADSVRLTEVTVHSYLSNRPLLRLPSSATVVDEPELKKQSGQSLVPVMNTLPGVRMEERSPGSYRLSIRGSLLRSPFGIRNVKVYLEDFPLTDAGGNTYLNLLDLNIIHSIEVLKGPDGSLFGANSGGVVRINTIHPDTLNMVKIGTGGGSYGLFQEYALVKHRFGKNNFAVGEGWQRSDGYRINSRFDRKYIQVTNQYQYYPKGKLTVLMFYSNLSYRTPGGLTYTEWIKDPHAARSPNGMFEGAQAQKAGVYNSTVYTGISNQVKLSKAWSHTIALFGSYTDFKNPFITNYEKRRENTLGARTWFQASNNAEGKILIKFHTGAEMAQTRSDITNYSNTHGVPTGSPVNDKITSNQLFIFNHLMFDFYNKWLLEAGLSLNFNSYSYYTIYLTKTPRYQRHFIPQLMPKVGVSYQIAALMAWRASISRGYSTPSLAEIRSSTNEVNTSLEPENGWNYETGIRLHTRNNILRWDISVFHYLLNNAIVRRVNEAGQEYFINAGGTKQTGLESQVSLRLFKRMEFNNALTISRFIFRNYSVGSNDYSGNKLTGVPSTTIVSGLRIQLPAQLYVFIQHNYTSSIFLNDANTVSSDPYHLMLLTAGCKLINRATLVLELSGGIDNLLDEKYSLGNDLNAAGGRYYNAAMPKNYFGKLEARF